MAEAQRDDENLPQLLVTAPSFPVKKSKLSKLTKFNSKGQDGDKIGSAYKRPAKKEKHVRLEEPESSRAPASSSSSIYMGSYPHSPHRRSRVSLSGSLKTPDGSVPPSPRASIGQLEHLLQDLNLELDTYGVEEFRDGFFDASFFKPPKQDRQELLKMAEYTLPASFRKRHPLSPSDFLPKQWHEIKGVVRRITTTRAGIKLSKSFIAYFIAYILCLLPIVDEWLGRYSYVMALSVIINHPGRTVGAQLDGALLTILGTAGGLGWGAFALWLSDSTSVAREGYGGILATFLLLFMAAIASMRAYWIRSYQLVLAAGTSVIFTCLADTSTTVSWHKLWDYGKPWLLGQSIGLVICCTIFPDAGARPLAVSLHAAFETMQDALILPRPVFDVSTHRRLAWTFVSLSQASRDLLLDLSITRFHPSDVLALRNLMQAVIRSLLALKTETELFKDYAEFSQNDASEDDPRSVINIDGTPSVPRALTEDQAVDLVTNRLGGPTLRLIECMRIGLAACDAVLMTQSGYRKYLGPPHSVSSDVLDAITSIRKAMIKFDEEDEVILQNPLLPPTYSNHPELVDLFLFVHPVRQAADSTEALLVKVNQMQQTNRRWQLYLPRYPFLKGLQRTNQQVRHDRGGISAGFYFQSQKQIYRMLKNLQMNTFKPSKRYKHPEDDASESGEDDDDEGSNLMDDSKAAKRRFGYKVWKVMHRLQGFETRFAFKVAIVTSLLAVPAWLSQSRGWYNEYQSWWSVVMAWVMFHPRVGGNFQDLVTRSLCGVIGATWGGVSYAAGDGNPYVMAVFAAIYMIPMMYRFTQSSHPRSGLVGCISFTVVSLTANIVNGEPGIATLAWTHGVAFVVGVVAAILVNWILWPFVARHELRKSLSNMMFYSAIIYRGVIAKYVYYQDGEGPSAEDVKQSELLEGRLREGFVRIRQLMALTRHEIRLRGPFNPLPYSGLIEGCESFFEHLVEVRQSSLFFHPNYMAGNNQASEALLPFRRDAVAAILMNLYILAGALKGDRRVPRYLPSAAAARKRLLDRMSEVELEHAQARGSMSPIPKKGVGRKFAEVYQFAYSQALTQCVEQLEQLQKYTKAICGEVGFDPIDDYEYEEAIRDRTKAPAFLDGTESRQ